MQSAGATKRHQRIAAGVDPAFNGDHAQRLLHVIVDQIDDAMRGVLDRQAAEQRGDPRHRGPRHRCVDADAPTQFEARWQPAEHDIGIGNRRLAPTEAIAGRTG